MSDERSEVIRAMFSDRGHGADYRDIGATHVCPCGCDMFNLICKFEDGEVAFYLRETRCTSCGSLLLAPIPEGVE